MRLFQWSRTGWVALKYGKAQPAYRAWPARIGFNHNVQGGSAQRHPPLKGPDFRMQIVLYLFSILE
jgi:hypothetical protein